MTIVAANDTVTYKHPNGNTQRPAELVIAVGPSGAAVGVSATEDAASVSGDSGVPALFVRTPAAPAAQTTTDGDYGFPAIDSFGDQKSLIVDSTGTALTYNANGQAVMASSMPVAIASNQSIIPIEHGPYTYSRKTADGQVKGSAGFVHTITVAALTATPTAGMFSVYDSLTETGTVLYSEWVFATDVGHSVILDVSCATGIYVGFDATLANVQVTVSYR